jgi:hypothetical protein
MQDESSLRQRRHNNTKHAGAAKEPSKTLPSLTKSTSCSGVFSRLVLAVVLVLSAALSFSAVQASYAHHSTSIQPLVHKPSLNLWRVISTLTGGLESIGILKVGHRSVQDLVSAAKASTGLDDLGKEKHATAALDNLQRILTVLEPNPNISTVLKVVLRELTMFESLVKRLKMVDVRKQNPDIAKVEVRKPIVLIGSWRTGEQPTGWVLTSRKNAPSHMM